MASDTGSDHARRSSITLAHSSDLHLASDYRPGEDLARLRAVLETARTAGADALLLAGDVFDHNRVKLSMIDEVSRAIADAGLPVVILPGNHDCLAPGSVYRRGGLGEVPNVEVLGITVDEALQLPELDLQIWGRPHLDHVDMSPLADPRRRNGTRWSVAMAHGHWVSGPQDHHRSWLIHQQELEALGDDYLALGHWDLATKVGLDGVLPAYYSGSPDLAKTVNLVRLGDTVEVVRTPLVPAPGG